MLHQVWHTPTAFSIRSHIRNGDLDVDAGLDVDGRDLLDGVLRRVEVDQALVDLHFEALPRVGAVTARALARDDDKGARWQPDGAAGADLLLLCAAKQVTANLLESLWVAAAHGDADFVDGLFVGRAVFLDERHC